MNGPWNLLLIRSSSTIRPADPAFADMPMIATLRGRIMAPMAKADMRLRSANSFVVISGRTPEGPRRCSLAI